MNASLLVYAKSYLDNASGLIRGVKEAIISVGELDEFAGKLMVAESNVQTARGNLEDFQVSLKNANKGMCHLV